MEGISYILWLDKALDAQNMHQNQWPNKTSPGRESMLEEKNLKCHFKLHKVGLQQTIGGSKFQSKGLFTEGSQQPAPPPTPVPPFLPQPARNAEQQLQQLVSAEVCVLARAAPSQLEFKPCEPSGVKLELFKWISIFHSHFANTLIGHTLTGHLCSPN